MTHQYKGPGKYIAVCIKMNHKGHYSKEFTVPDEEQYQDVLASWYFLNVEDGVAYLEAVYPLDVFLPLTDRVTV